MKTYFSFKFGLAYGLVLILLFTSCQSDEISESSVLVEDTEITETAEESDPTLRINTSHVFPITARVLGKSNAEWAMELGRASVKFTCETVQTPHLVNLSDKVVAPYGALEDSNDEYTITKDQFVFISPAFFFNNYPCPAEYDWEPAPGQSIEDFLKEYAKNMINSIENIEVIINGIAIEDIGKYRLSTDLFYFTGNPVLAECYDDCITGEPQPGLVDGYFMMLKKLKKGRHSVILKGEVPSQDFTYSATINLNVI